MKSLKKYLAFIVVIGLLINCKGNGNTDPTPDVDEVQATIDGLNKIWNVTSATLDGRSVTNNWTGVKFTFTNTKSFTATGLSTENSLIWPSSGSYTIPDVNKPLNLLRNDGIDVTLKNLAASSVDVTFAITGRINGKVNGLTGNYTFSLSN